MAVQKIKKREGMPMKLKTGFIYFLGERDLQTGEWSDQVKIGRTDYDRPVSDRIDDHQTGNPRQITDHESFQVASVDTVETHLHHAFAEYRTSGEWFRMDESTLKEAIAEGKRIDAEIKKSAQALASSADANNEVSSEPERAPDEEELSLLGKAVEAGEALNRLKARQASLEWELRASMGSAKGIDGILCVMAGHFARPLFDEEALLADEPDIHEQFQIEESSLKRSFSLATKTRSVGELEPDLVARQKEWEEVSIVEFEGLDKPAAERSAELADLHEQYLKVLGEVSRAKINKDLLEARIKTACGTARGIDGVCRWSREVITQKKFDHSSFEQAHPELFAKYLLPAPVPELRVSVNLMRSYNTNPAAAEEELVEKPLQRQVSRKIPTTQLVTAGEDNGLVKRFLLYFEEGLERKHAEQTARWFDRFTGPITVEVVDRAIRLTPNDQGNLVWDEVFSTLGEVRQEDQIPASTFIVLLTKTPNEQNWFAVQDPNQMRNGFIHFGDFSWVTSAPSEIIAAHFILKGLYNILLHEAQVPWKEMFHQTPRGCLFDFCADKQDLSFNLRTADVCGDCMQVFQSVGIPDAILKQTVAIMEGTRRLAINTGQFMEQEASFHDWPFPVAVTRHKIVQASNPLLRFMLLLDHFDCLVRYAYLSREVIAGKIPEVEDRPSLGWWVNRLADSVKDRTSFREVVRIAEEERVVNLRNERRGHGWMAASEESYRSDAENLETIIDKIEDELRPFLEGQRLVVPRQISLKNSSWLVEGHKLMGSHVLHPPFQLETEGDLREMGMTGVNEVFLADSRMEKFHKISPSVRSDFCPKCQLERILLTDGGRKYIDVFMGHRVKLQNS
jgi:hypothetical protein